MKTAVISGGAGGLGRALAGLLVARGWRCVLLDLDAAGIDGTPQQVTIACDLTDVAERDAAIARILVESDSVDLVVHAAGITHVGPCDTLSEAALRKVMEINFFAAVALAQGFRDALRHARGAHLVLSSVAGFAPLHHRTAYAASKHALEGFFASLRSEERAHGVRVIVAAPSFIATNPGQGANPDGTARPGSAADEVDAMTAQDAAAAILRGLDRGQEMIPVGRVARLAWWLHRLSPRLYQRMMERNIAGRR